MPEITSVFQNSPSFNNPSFETEFIFLADINSVTVFCSADCEFGFRWSVDNQFQVISTDTFPLSAGTEQSILVPITARYCQFFVTTSIVYERNGNLIEPVTTPANVISGGNTNTIPANCNQCGIVCGTSNSMNYHNCDNSCIAGGNLNSIARNFPF